MMHSATSSQQQQKTGGLQLAFALVKQAVHFAPTQAAIFGVLSFVVTLTQGIGLLLIIPLLAVIGVGDSGSTVTRETSRIFHALGLPLTLSTMLLLFVSLIAILASLRLLLTKLQLRMTHGFSLHLKTTLFQAISRSNWLTMVESRSSDLVQALTFDTLRIGHGVRVCLTIITSTLLLTGYLIVSAFLSWQMTLVALISILLLGILAHPFLGRTARRANKAHKSMLEFQSIVQEALAGLKSTIAFGLADKCEEHFSLQAKDIRDKLISVEGNKAWNTLITQIGSAVLLALFVLVAHTMFSMTTAKILVMTLIITRTLPTLGTLQNQWHQLADILPVLSTFMGYVHRFASTQEGDDYQQLSPLILKQGLQFDKVSFAYKNKRVLKDLCLTLPAKTTTALIGPSGSGKTTIADMVLGLLTPSAGQVLVDGLPLEGTKLREWRAAIGYVPQGAHLLHDTIRANLLLIRPDADEEAMRQALEMAACDFVFALPEGLDTVIGDNGTRLSGGEHQRISLAQALLREPSMLILDEATSHLDSESENTILQSVDALSDQMTILVIAHRLSTVRNADQILVIENGNIIEQGSWDELKQLEKGRFEQILHVTKRALSD